MAGDWSDAANDLIVSDYFAMLAKELSGQSYSKTEHRRTIVSQIGRSEGSVEFKHQNISAVLVGAGETWITGYKPAFNYQRSLRNAVARWFEDHFDELPDLTLTPRDSLADAANLYVRPPPTMRNEPPPKELEKTKEEARFFDVAARDERNRRLGEAGERLTLAREKLHLKQNGRSDLSNEVIWVAKEEGDSAGFDIRSFEPNGAPRLVEVKTTNGWERTPFYISRNEVAAAEQNRDSWVLFRVHSFARTPGAFEIRPPLDRHVELTATSFQASFR